MTEHQIGLGEEFGLPVYSLLDVFKDTEEEIYKDHAHVNSLGNEIMARRIADLIETVWGWPRHRDAGVPASRLRASSGETETETAGTRGGMISKPKETEEAK